MKTKKIMDEATDSRTHKRAYLEGVLHCSRCPPNKGCNRRVKKKDRSWKTFKKNKHD